VIYLLILLGFLVRALPRWRLRNVYVSDTYFHLFCAAVIRDHNFRLPQKLPRVLLEHDYSYPYLYHLLLALFPSRARLWAERLTGATFDTLALILVYGFTVWGMRQAPILEGALVPLWIAALFVFAPGLLRLGSGPRAYNGSPRTVGQMLYLLHLLSAYYASVTQSLLALAISLIAGAVLIITAKFGTQVFVFFGTFFTLFVSPNYLLIGVGCLFMAWILSWGRSWMILYGQIRHSLNYFKNMQHIFLYPHVRSFKDYRSRVTNAIRTFRWNVFLEWLLYSETYPLHIFITVFPQFFMLGYYLFKINRASSLNWFLFIWVCSGFFWFIATKWKPLLFLGEGERYLEYALFPSLFLAVQYLQVSAAGILYALLIYSIGCALFHARQFHKIYQPLNSDYAATETIFNSLDRSPLGTVWPIGSFHYQALARIAQHPILTHGCNMDERNLAEIMLVYGNYPYPSDRFSEILQKYQVSYIISDRAHLKFYSEQILKDPKKIDSLTCVLWEVPSLVVCQVLENKA
jgi:hypothetical protein